MDEPARPRPRRADDPDHRGGVCPLPLRSEGRPCPHGKVLSGPKDAKFTGDKAQFIEDVRQALYASKLCSYAQGYVQLDAAAQEFGWKLNNGNIALLWHSRCVVRSRFLGDIKAAFDKNPSLENLLLDDFFKQAIDKAQPSWRRVLSTSVQLGLPTPVFSTQALSYYDGYRHGRLPANLLQAQHQLLRGPHLRTPRQTPRRNVPHRLDPRTQAELGRRIDRPDGAAASSELTV